MEPGNRHVAWEDKSFRAYAAHMETPEFRAKLHYLLELSTNHRVAVMCAESLWWRCHRRLIADAAVVAGFDVLHLGERKRQHHELTRSARVDDDGLLVYDQA